MEEGEVMIEDFNITIEDCTEPLGLDGWDDETYHLFCEFLRYEDIGFYESFESFFKDFLTHNKDDLVESFKGYWNEHRLTQLIDS